jgi:hypothetical protein
LTDSLSNLHDALRGTGMAESRMLLQLLVKNGHLYPSHHYATSSLLHSNWKIIRNVLVSLAKPKLTFQKTFKDGAFLEYL